MPMSTLVYNAKGCIIPRLFSQISSANFAKDLVVIFVEKDSAEKTILIFTLFISFQLHFVIFFRLKVHWIRSKVCISTDLNEYFKKIEMQLGPIF